MVQINYKNNKRKYENNVIYEITIGNYTYIGLTSRPLELRIREHVYSSKSPINNFIKENKVNQINVRIIKKLPSNKKLDKKETKAIASYILKTGKKLSKQFLLNRDFKGLENLSIKDLRNAI